MISEEVVLEETRTTLRGLADNYDFMAIDIGEYADVRWPGVIHDLQTSVCETGDGICQAVKVFVQLQ